MSWLTEGPLSRFGSDSNMARGARIGSAGGPVGMALGALGGWLMDRHESNQRAEMNAGLSNTLGNDIQQTQDRIWGGGGGTLPQFQGDDMGPPEGLAGADQTGAGPPADENGDGRVTPDERRDAANSGYTPANYGVSNFMVGGSPVIFGSGDPMGRYLRNQRQPGG